MGAFIQKLTYTSTIISILAYFSYALGRIVSMVMDGNPADGLIKATVVEVIIGLVSTWALIKYKSND